MRRRAAGGPRTPLGSRVTARVRARVASARAGVVARWRASTTVVWRGAVALTDRAEGRVYEAAVPVYGVLVVLSLPSGIPIAGGLALVLLLLSVVAARPWRSYALAVSVAPLVVQADTSVFVAPAVALATYASYRTSRSAFVLVVVLPSLVAGYLSARTFSNHLGIVAAALAAGAALGWSTQARSEASRLAKANTALSRRAASSEQRSAWLSERLDLARELHDVVGHQVTGMVVQAEAARFADGDRDAALREIATLGRAALSELDVLVRRIRVVDADEQARVPELAEVTRTVTRLLELRGITPTVTVDADAFDGFDGGERLSLCRILQEAVVNVVRHSGADVARISVGRTGTSLDVVVADDGRGTDGAARGAGLEGLDERVRLLGGTWHLVGSHPRGSVLSVRVPVPAGADR